MSQPDRSEEFTNSGKRLITDYTPPSFVNPPHYQGDPGDENDFVEPCREPHICEEVHDIVALDEPSMEDYPTRPSDDEQQETMDELMDAMDRVDGMYRRSYVVTYKIGTIYRTDTILGYDSFAATAALAAGLAKEGEVVQGLRELN